MKFQTPIVLFIYNRPALTRQLMEVIKTLEPENLFIIGDGPKNEEDKDRINETRAIATEINWKCHLRTDFSDRNLGCANRIISGLNLVFSHTEKAIILEDDCIPHASFFSYCEELLNRFENDEKIMHISGFNVLGKVSIEESYFFSKFILPPWGWATWKRAWNKFNFHLNTWQEIKTTAYKNISQEYFADWTDMFENIRVNRTTWDTPWNVDIWKYEGIGILPAKNLVCNIGQGANATFTKNKSEISELPSHEINFPLIHPIKKTTPFDKEIEQKIISAIRTNLIDKK